MGRIKLLPKEVAEFIAAGEVIERPCSVIKELVENSIDSGATAITVEIKNGGVTYMRVTDNGCGIAAADVPTAFLRHATSKISSEADLNSIFTLGFRGEALASIVAVSKVDMLTKTAADEYGTHYVIEGTEELLNESVGCPDGTTIVIREIFYNVPARMKFLKSDNSEGNAVASIVKKIALSHPEISFKFIRDNKSELFTSGSGELYSTIYSVFGKQFAAGLIPVDYTYENVKVTGFTVKPTFARANRSFQSYFVNGRYVRSLILTTALDEAYKNSIMTGKFPACVLMIDVSPALVDVNVHPAKTEVRFSDESLIRNSVVFAVKNALLLGDSPNSFEFKDKRAKPASYGVVTAEAEPMRQTAMKLAAPTAVYSTESISASAPPVFYGSVKDNTITGKANDFTGKAPYVREADSPFQSEEKPLFDRELPRDEPSADTSYKYINSTSFIRNEEPVITEEEIRPEIRIIGEAFMNYIIAEVEGELILIDKHAAHERIIFERIRNNEQALSCQLCLKREGILLTDEQYAALAENASELAEMGFSLVFESSPTVFVEGMPTILDRVPPDEILPEIADNIINGGGCEKPSVLDEIYHFMACKAAIKAHDKNNIAELKALAEAVYGNDEIRYCPHGRPVMITMSKYQIEKQFKRIL